MIDLGLGQHAERTAPFEILDLRGVGGFGHHLHVATVFHQAAQAGPHNVVVVGEKDSYHFKRSCCHPRAI